MAGRAGQGVLRATWPQRLVPRQYNGRSFLAVTAVGAIPHKQGASEVYDRLFYASAPVGAVATTAPVRVRASDVLAPAGCVAWSLPLMSTPTVLIPVAVTVSRRQNSSQAGGGNDGRGKGPEASDGRDPTNWAGNDFFTQRTDYDAGGADSL